MKVDVLDIVCNANSRIPIPYRLAIVTCQARVGSASSSAGGNTIENAVVGRFSDDRRRVVIAVPDVRANGKARITVLGAGTVEVFTGPVRDFEMVMMPSSHLCFGYLRCLPEHISAGRIVAEAVDLVDKHPSYRWSVEFTRSVHKLFSKYPGLAEKAREMYSQRRLSVGAIWTPSTFEHFDAEAEVRQLVEAQWWLRENLGRTSPMVMGCDSSGFDPQQPQVFKQAGIDFYWRSRYTLVEKAYGSPFGDHIGADGTRLPFFTSRQTVSWGYIWPLIDHLWPEPKGKVSRLRQTEFAHLVVQTQQYLANSRDTLGTDVNFHFCAKDQGHARQSHIDDFADWNAVFRTPRISVASAEEAAERLLKLRKIKRDQQEGEQPHWAPTTIAGYRLTLPFQQASNCLCTAEKAAAIDMLVNGAAYPDEELSAAWMNILSEQHHEQLGWGAYDQVERARDGLHRAISVAEGITRGAAGRIASKIDFSRPDPAVTVFNFLNWTRTGIVETNAAAGNARVCDESGNPVPSEITTSGSVRFAAEVDGMGYRTYYICPAEKPSEPAPDLASSATSIENEFYRLEFDPNTGCVSCLYDKQMGLCVSPGGADRLPFELVVNEDSGKGYCSFAPTGRLWRASECPGAKVTVEMTGLAARVVVDRPLLSADGEARVGSRLRICYELPTRTRRLDVEVAVDWDSEPKRELRVFVPVAIDSPKISYDTLFSTSDYDPELPVRQHLEITTGSRASDERLGFYDYRNVTRFVSAYDQSRDFAVTVTAPHGLLRVEHGGVSFSLIEDRTDTYVHIIPPMTGHHVFHLSLTTHRGDWRQGKDWRFGWEHRGRFNDLVAVSPERLYPVIPERGQMARVVGAGFVLTALKKSHEGERLVARVYDAAGTGGEFGFRLGLPYLGKAPHVWWAQKYGGSPIEETVPYPLELLKADETNLLEDARRRIEPGLVESGKVAVRPWGIFTAVLDYETPLR